MRVKEIIRKCICGNKLEFYYSHISNSFAFYCTKCNIEIGSDSMQELITFQKKLESLKGKNNEL